MVAKPAPAKNRLPAAHRTKMRVGQMLFLATAFAGFSCWSFAYAMEFVVEEVPNGKSVIILGTGPIIQGDRVRLVAAIDSAPLDQTITGFGVESPGGNVIEAERLASTIHTARLAIAVGPGGQCASACFLLFAAGSMRIAHASSRIGVHSVSENGTENLSTMATTTALARDAAAYAVPSAIIGRLVTTPPGDVAWLTRAELVSWGVTILPDPAPDRSLVAPPPPQPVGQSPADQAAAQPAEPAPAFRQGRADRQAITAWIAGLTPDARSGAEFWAAQRSLRKPGSCFQPPAPPPQSIEQWSAGCVAAQSHLAQSDIRRKAEPDYKAGWNSF